MLKKIVLVVGITVVLAAAAFILTPGGGIASRVSADTLVCNSQQPSCTVCNPNCTSECSQGCETGFGCSAAAYPSCPSCTSDSQCGSGDICESGSCTAGCQVTGCNTGYSCQDNQCVQNAPSGGGPTGGGPTGGGPTGTGPYGLTPCTSSSQCPASQSCYYDGIPYCTDNGAVPGTCISYNGITAINNPSCQSSKDSQQSESGCVGTPQTSQINGQNVTTCLVWSQLNGTYTQVEPCGLQTNGCNIVADNYAIAEATAQAEGCTVQTITLPFTEQYSGLNYYYNLIDCQNPTDDTNNSSTAGGPPGGGGPTNGGTGPGSNVYVTGGVVNVNVLPNPAVNAVTQGVLAYRESHPGGTTAGNPPISPDSGAGGAGGTANGNPIINQNPGSGGIAYPATVTVTAETLNVRSSPSISGTLTSTLSAGDTFTAVSSVEGDSVEGNDVWLVSSKGNYVWSGGTDVAEGGTVTANPPSTLVTTSSLSGVAFPADIEVTASILNVRSSPSTSGALTGTVNAGNTFTAVSAVQGDSVDGNDIWWVSSAGNYVWSGGTTVVIIGGSNPPAGGTTGSGTGNANLSVTILGAAGVTASQLGFVTIGSAEEPFGASGDTYEIGAGTPFSVSIAPVAGYVTTLGGTCSGTSAGSGTSYSCAVIYTPENGITGGNGSDCSCSASGVPSCANPGTGGAVTVPSSFSCGGITPKLPGVVVTQ